jgi:cell division protein FtsL
VQLINDRVVSKIREVYSLNDEIKMIRLSPSEESTAYNDYVEECRDWGRTEKARLGL